MSGVTDSDRGYAKMMADLAAIKAPVVVVGIRQEKGAVIPPRADGRSGSATIVEAATYNEFGTGQIPARPAFRTTVDAHRAEYADEIQQGVEAAIDGKRSLEQSLGLLGVHGTRDIQRAIIDWESPPNAPSTIRRKKGVNDPLTGIGRTRQSIDHEVRMGGLGAEGSS